MRKYTSWSVTTLYTLKLHLVYTNFLANTYTVTTQKDVVSLCINPVTWPTCKISFPRSTYESSYLVDVRFTLFFSQFLFCITNCPWLCSIISTVYMYMYSILIFTFVTMSVQTIGSMHHFKAILVACFKDCIYCGVFKNCSICTFDVC